MTDTYTLAGIWFDRMDKRISNIQNSKKFYNEYANELGLDEDSRNWGNCMIEGYLAKDREIKPEEFAAGAARLSSEFGKKPVSASDVSEVANVPTEAVTINENRIGKSMTIYPFAVFSSG